jgi:DNA-binding transcriptional ArsR family regulator
MSATGSIHELPDLADIDVLDVLQALSDPVRLEMVRQLASCPATDGLQCGQMKLPVKKAAASHHLKVLWEAGLVDAEKQGVYKIITLRRRELDRRFPGLLDSVLGAVPAAKGS